MIAHAIHIIRTELNQHIVSGYTNVPSTAERVTIGNISLGVEGTQGGTLPAGRIIMTLVNYKEEKTLKNLSSYTRDDTNLKVIQENPPVFLNFFLLFAATHTEYRNALIDLSRTFRFFQSKNVFTPDNTSPASLSPHLQDVNTLDHLESFKLIMELYSPTLEEVNHLWGTLGGRQFPFALYTLRMLDLKYKFIQEETGVITSIDKIFRHKDPIG